VYHLPVIVTLSTGETVTLKDRFTHKMHKALFQAINKGVSWKQNVESGEYEKEVPAENIEFQYEALFPTIIEKIERRIGTTRLPPPRRGRSQDPHRRDHRGGREKKYVERTVNERRSWNDSRQFYFLRFAAL
jgi:hypothetical protein